MNTSSSQPVRKVPPGGSATINGVLYQMLWSLLRASRAHIANASVGENGELQEVTIILEPHGGGGDLVMQTAGQREVEQLKARPDGSTWSLREVVEKVIPDLYLAGTDKADQTTYRFVTEGRMGTWKKQYDFFRSISKTPIPTDPSSHIDNTTPLKKVKKKKKKKKKNTDGESTAATDSFWNRDTYTAQELFLQIVSEVRKRKAVSKSESETDTQKKLRFVLANFEFVGGQDMMAVQREIDSHLLAVVAKNDDVPQIRDLLAVKLALLATKGSVEINCKDFFEENGLNAIPLTAWARMRFQSKKVAELALQCFGYDPLLDVRTAKAEQIIVDWPATVPVLAITGESGSGKSWTSYAICSLIQASESLCTVVAAGATTDETLSRASASVWQEIAGHNESIPLSCIAARIRRVIGAKLTPWLTLVIDGVTERHQAIELIQRPWESWGIRLVLAVNKRDSNSLEQRSNGRCRIITVGNFSNRELREYLSSFLGDGWPEMPKFMRNLLQVPLLAGIYRQITLTSNVVKWIPQSEYDLVVKFWSRAEYIEPMDSEVLVNLAEKYLIDAVYPWPIREMQEAGAQEATIRRLEQAGWIQTSHSITGNTIGLSHFRLLNWVCSIALLRQLERKQIDLAQLCAALESYLHGTSRQHGHRLGFVPMDLLWMMSQNPSFRGQIPAVIASLEGHYMQSEDLYAMLLPTLGPQIVDGLLSRLRDAINDWYVPSLVAGSIATIGGNPAVDAGLLLLQDKDPLLRLVACSVFAECPSSRAMDLLWQLHNDCAADPNKYLRDREKQNAHVLCGKTFAAVGACCCELPDWLDGAIANADPAKESISDLAYLLATVELEQGRKLWAARKALLIAKMPADKLSAIATCIRRFVDADEVPWLLAHLEKENLIGVAAASALVRVDPSMAIRELHRIPRKDAFFAKNWYLDHLFVTHRVETQQRIRDLMGEEGAVWKTAEFYQGRAHLLDIDTLKILLLDLEQKLTVVLSESDWGDREPLYYELSLLAKVNTKFLLDHIQTLAGTGIEELLTRFVLRIGPRNSRSRDSYVHEAAIEFLLRINGIGFTNAVNDELQAESRDARLKGMVLAGKKADLKTLQLLTTICQQDETCDGFYHEQCRAAVVLAQHDEWDPVLQLVRKIGLQVLSDVTDLPRCGLRPPLASISSIANLLPQNSINVPVGDAIVLGFGDSSFSPHIRAIARECELDSDLAHACVIALELMQDHDEASVPFLRNQLQVEPHRFSATNALIINGTQLALDALATGAADEISGAVGVNLIERSSDKAAAIEKVRTAVLQSVQNDRAGDYVCDLHRLVQMLRDDAVICDILSHNSVEEYLYSCAFDDETNYWRVGKKAAAIQCLALIDRNEAFLAAKTSLRNPHAHDRTYYPAILAAMSPDLSIKILFDQLIAEWTDPSKGSKTLVVAIGRSISKLPIDALLLEYFASPDPLNRRAACFAAGWGTINNDCSRLLTASLTDPDESVTTAAVAAINLRFIRNECQTLGDAIMSGSTECQRWLYLDCLLSLADLGDEHHHWPIEGPPIGNVLTPFQKSYVNDQLKKLRDK